MLMTFNVFSVALKKSSDIIATNETRIAKQSSLLNNLDNFFFELTPTETSAPFFTLKIYKYRNDLNI